MAGFLLALLSDFTDVSTTNKSRIANVVFLVAVLLIGYNGLSRLVLWVRVLPEHVYQGTSITAGAFTVPLFLTVFCLPMLFLLLGYRTLSWGRFEFAREIRWLMLLTALPFLWTYATYDFNLYYNQPHHVDRLLLVVLFTLIWKHPMFVYPFLLLSAIISGQIYYPFGSLAGYTDQHLPLSLLVLFSSFLFFKLKNVESFKSILNHLGLGDFVFNYTNDERVFLWIASGLIGASYFAPAIEKVLTVWPTRTALQYYIPLTYKTGWLGHLEPDLIMQIYRWLALANPALVWGTLAIQAAAIALVWRKRAFVLIILGFVAFHLSVFLTSGIFFWKWVILLLAFLGCVLIVDSKSDSGLFNRETICIVTVLILLGPFIFKVTWLGWYTTNYEEVYRVELVDENREAHEIHWSDMGHYYYHFKSNRFGYIHEENVIDGRSDYRVTASLRNADSYSDVQRIKARYGDQQYDPERAEAFDRFIERYFTAYQRENDRSHPWSSIPSPPHFWSTVPTDPPPRDENYTYVQIRKVEYLVADGEVREINSTIVREVPLDE